MVCPPSASCHRKRLPGAAVSPGVVRFILGAAVILVGYGCGHTPTGSTANAVLIRGRVLDFRTETGVPGALVEFVGQSHPGSGRASTDVTGSYAMSLPSPRSYAISVDGAEVGTTLVTGTGYRGDVLARGGPCVSRYGSLSDARTLRPITGATVSIGIGLGATTSGPDGWYRLDLGCPVEGWIGDNTTFMSVTHPSYVPLQQVVGLGVRGVERLDLELKRR